MSSDDATQPAAPAARGLDFEALQTVLREDAFSPTDSAGLFVGVRTFVDQEGHVSTSLLEIPYAVDDAIDLCWLFVTELKLLLASQTTLLLSGKPQKEESQRRLRTLLASGAKEGAATLTSVLPRLTAARRRAGPGGLLVMSFATHGYAANGDKLLLADSSLADLELTSLPLTRVLDDVASAQAPRRLVFIDACRERVVSARAVGSQTVETSNILASAIAAARGMAILSATTSGGFSYDDPERRNGVFTARVLEGLHGAAPADARGFITAQSLAHWVDGEVRRWILENRPEADEARAGISFQLEDLRSGAMPLAVARTGGGTGTHAPASPTEQVQAMVRAGLLSSPEAEGVLAALETRGDPVVEPVVEALRDLQPGQEAAFVAWWRAEGPSILQAIAYLPPDVPEDAEKPPAGFLGGSKPVSPPLPPSGGGAPPKAPQPPLQPVSSEAQGAEVLPQTAAEKGSTSPPSPPSEADRAGAPAVPGVPPPARPGLLSRLLMPGVVLGCMTLGVSLWKYKETSSLVLDDSSPRVVAPDAHELGSDRDNLPPLHRSPLVQLTGSDLKGHELALAETPSTGVGGDLNSQGAGAATGSSPAKPDPRSSPSNGLASNAGPTVQTLPSTEKNRNRTVDQQTDTSLPDESNHVSIMDQTRLSRMSTVVEKARAVYQVHAGAGYSIKSPPELLGEAVRELTSSINFLGNVVNSDLKGEEAGRLKNEGVRIREDSRRLMASLKRLQTEQSAAKKTDPLSQQVERVYEQGKAAAAKGDVAGATQAFQEVQKLDPRNSTLYSRLASEQLQLLGVQVGATKTLKPVTPPRPTGE